MAFFNSIGLCCPVLQFDREGIPVIYRNTKQPLETHPLSRQEEKTHDLAKKGKEARVWKTLPRAPRGNIYYFHLKQQLPTSAFIFIDSLAASECDAESSVLFDILLLLFKFHFKNSIGNSQLTSMVLTFFNWLQFNGS